MALSWINLSATLLYFAGLLGVAVLGDRHAARFSGERTRRIVYVLGLGVYCTSWTFFGSVGLASTNGLDFLPIYIGPMLVFGFGWPLVARVARLARAQNITSIADFLAARYGKSEAVAAVGGGDRGDRRRALYRLAAQGDFGDSDHRAWDRRRLFGPRRRTGRTTSPSPSPFCSPCSPWPSARGGWRPASTRTV